MNGQLDLLPREGIDWSRLAPARRVWMEDIGGDHGARMEFLADRGLRLVMADLASAHGETLHFSSPRDGETLHLRAGDGKSLLEEAEGYFPAAARWRELLVGAGDMGSSGTCGEILYTSSGVLLEVEAGRVTHVADAWRDYPQSALPGAKAAQAVLLLERDAGMRGPAAVVAFAQALEEARGLKVPALPLALRAMHVESARVLEHLRWMAGAASSLGRPRVASPCESLRLDLQSGMEEWLGDIEGRGWIVPGGVREDYPLAGIPPFLERLKGMAAAWGETSPRVLSLPVPGWLEKRVRSLRAEASNGGWVGPLARAAGLDVDARSEEPGVCAVAGWEAAIPPGGAGVFRGMLELRAGEVTSSLGMMARVLADLPEPPLLVKRGRGGGGEGFGRCEGPDGEVCCHVTLEKGRVRHAAFSLPGELNRSAANVLKGHRLDEIYLVSLLWEPGLSRPMR